MDGGDEATRALAREVGRQSVDRLGDGLTRIIGESSALFRWLLTMLVLLNAAGLWFVVTFPPILSVDAYRGVAAIFFLGLLAAILAAVLSLIFTWPVARAMRRAITYWTEVSVSGELTDDAMLSASRVKIMSTIWLLLTSLTGAASLALFVAGATSASGGGAAISRSLDLLPPDELTEPADNGADGGNEVADLLNQAVPTNAAAPVAAAARAPAPATAQAPRPSAASTPAARPTPRPTTTPTSRPSPPAPQRPAAAPSPALSPSPAPVALPPVPAPAEPTATP